MDAKLFNYLLPEELIADRPLKRGESRMMVLHRDKETVANCKFSDLPHFIDSNTTVVFNSTKVIPARIFGKRKSGGAVEFLLLKQLKESFWQVMVKSSKYLLKGEVIAFEHNLEAEIISRESQFAEVEFSLHKEKLLSYLNDFGDIPLPPYILKRRNEQKSRKEDRALYQTVYANTPGSVAAPTAGLHFDAEILKKIHEITEGHIENILLDVGLGTFLPVKSEKVEEHTMHKERFLITKECAERLSEDKKNGRKILAVGTTTVRALESASDENGNIKPCDKETGIFIYPGYQFKFADKILTNFHLPQSTLLMMISAFAGREFVFKAYKEAVKERYRFYSYGDCMLIM
ncbi:MAG: tRNA preQ1(34) S-adenosylmethionine ribosyltransferase-isomerase QueA [bacterium]